MNRKKCPSCGFLAFGNNIACNKCGQPLSPAKRKAEGKKVSFGVPTFTINGCGISLIDYRETNQEGIYEVMKWITVLNVPIIPLSGWLVAPKYLENTLPGSYREYSFVVIDKNPLEMIRVLRILGINFISIMPLLIAILLFDQYSKIFGLEWGGIAFVGAVILSIFWMLGVHWRYTDNGEDKYPG